MKKLMIALAAVAMAAVAQAATVTWSASNIALSGEKESYYAMLLDVGSSELTTAADVAAALKAGKFDGTVMWQGDAVVNKGLVVVSAKNQALPSGYDAGDNVTYMTILFDAASASAAEKYLATSGESAVAGSITDIGALSLAQGKQDGKTWNTIAVPEPTSGLLMLLGMAGLALRRRRA